MNLIQVIKESNLSESIKENLLWHIENQYCGGSFPNEKLFDDNTYFTAYYSNEYYNLNKIPVSNKLDIDFEKKEIKIKYKGEVWKVKDYINSFDGFLNDFINGNITVEWTNYKQLETIKNK
ncbi:MAG: hypothetical protein ACRC0V_12780 [Fusobacteriaceae bacterium]